MSEDCVYLTLSYWVVLASSIDADVDKWRFVTVAWTISLQTCMYCVDATPAAVDFMVNVFGDDVV